MSKIRFDFHVDIFNTLHYYGELGARVNLSFAGNYRDTYTHKNTGVKIHISETFEEIDYLYASADTKTQMEDFKAYINILNIN